MHEDLNRESVFKAQKVIKAVVWRLEDYEDELEGMTREICSFFAGIPVKKDESLRLAWY